MLDIASGVGTAIRVINEDRMKYKLFLASVDHMTEQDKLIEINKYRSNKRKELNEELEHKRKLEIAEAGRARNFWGD